MDSKRLCIVLFFLHCCVNSPVVLAGRPVLYPDPSSTNTVLIEDHRRNTLVQSPGGLSSFFCKACPQDVTLHTSNATLNLALSWIGSRDRGRAFSDVVRISLNGEPAYVVNTEGVSASTLLLNVSVVPKGLHLPLQVSVGNWSRTVNILRDNKAPTASIQRLSERDIDDVHEYRMKVTFSEPVVRNSRKRCSNVERINSTTPVSTVLRQSNGCTKELFRRRTTNAVIAKGVRVLSVSTVQNAVLYIAVRTFSRLKAYDINVTLDSSIEDFSGNRLRDVPYLLLFYRPVKGVPSFERLNRMRKRRMELTPPPSYSGAKAAGRAVSVVVVGSCTSSLTSSAGTGSSGGATALIMNVQKIYMTGLIAVTKLPRGYKKFTGEVGWAMLDIDTPWRDKKTNSTSETTTRSAQRSLKVLEFMMEAESDESAVLYFERISFWAPTIFFGAVILHACVIVIFLVKQWELPDLLQPPRIEILIGFFLLPPIAVASAGLYQSNRADAMLGTWIIIAIPFNFLCWSCFMLWFYILRPPPHLKEANQITEVPSQRQRALRQLRRVFSFSRNRGAVASGTTGHRTSSSVASTIQFATQSRSPERENGAPNEPPPGSSNEAPSGSSDEATNTTVNRALKRSSAFARWDPSVAMYKYHPKVVNSRGELIEDAANEPRSWIEIYQLLSRMDWMTRLFGEHLNDAEWSATRAQGSKFVARYGPLFEEHRGPAIGRRDATLEVDPITGRVDRGTLVVIRERPLVAIPSVGRPGSLFHLPRMKIYRFHLQSVAKLLEITKTILVGCIVAGVGNTRDNVGSIVALAVLSLTLLVLFRIAKPFPSRVDMLVLLITELGDLIVYLCALYLLLGPDTKQSTYDNISVALIVSEGFGLVSMVSEYALISLGMALLAWEEYKTRFRMKFFDVVHKVMKEDGRYLQRKYFDLWMVKVFGKVCCVIKTKISRRSTYFPRNTSRVSIRNRRRIIGSKDSIKSRLPIHNHRQSDSALKAAMTGVGLAKDIYCAQPWWSRHQTQNMIHINSPEQMLHALSTAGNRLVVIDFYAKWCRSCRALHPKLSQICAANPNLVLLKVNWDENIDLCKVMGVQVLPFFHLFRRPFGRQTSFTLSVSRIGRLRDAIKLYGVPLEDSHHYPGVEELKSIDLNLDEDLKTVAGQLERLKTIFSIF